MAGTGKKTSEMDEFIKRFDKVIKKSDITEVKKTMKQARVDLSNAQSIGQSATIKNVRVGAAEVLAARQELTA
jgi:hypothetical protein